MRRRTLLRWAGLGLVGFAAVPLAGCTQGPTPAPTGSGSSGPTDDSSPSAADNALRERVAAEESALLSRYEATMAAHPALAAQLRPLAEQHRDHHRAMLGSDGATPTDAPPAIPADPAAAVADLAAAERSAAEARTSACLEAQVTDTARLLALIAASEASHAEALGGVAS